MASQRISKADIETLGRERLAQILLQLALRDAVVYSTLQEHLKTSAPDPTRSRHAAAAEEPYMVGSSAAMRRVFEVIRKVASADAPVLITGESGTGKELAAHAIHERSRRAGGPFVVIDCAILPPTLVGSELFGHERGAFTGAHERKIGEIERADGGTVFLDEIGDLPLDMQVHLLRFLQEGTIHRVGGRGPIRIDARVIAATNVDLLEARNDGRFREDLYYRLNVLNMEMPALRDRGEDIALLSRFFLEKLAGEMGRPVRGFSNDCEQAILNYAWPGNVRELIATVRRAVVMADGERITVADLGLPRAGPGTAKPAPMTLEEARSEAECRLIRKALQTHRNNIKEAAGALRVSRPTLYRLMEKHRLGGSVGAAEGAG